MAHPNCATSLLGAQCISGPQRFLGFQGTLKYVHMSGYDTCSPRCPGHLWLLLRPNSPVVVETLGTGETGLMYHYFIWDDPPPARCVYFQPLIPLDPQTQLQGWSDSTTNRALAEATRVQTLVPQSTETS